MEARTHWVFDDFFPDAPLMREKIEAQFDERIGSKRPLRERTIWNYWYIDKLYTYFRSDPRAIFPELHIRFMSFLKSFAASEFGMEVSNPFLSMYINGCGQGLHNDAKNGQLGYVFSLTKWKERRFEGGETIIHKFDTRDTVLREASGKAFFETVEPEFNRMVLFDDRLPHGVRTIQGTMNPIDARFVLHGHFEAPPKIAHIEGSLTIQDVTAQWHQMNQAVRDVFNSCGYHGFVTFEIVVDASGNAEITAKHAQLLPLLSQIAQDFSTCLDETLSVLSRIQWPARAGSSRLICAICSD